MGKAAPGGQATRSEGSAGGKMEKGVKGGRKGWEEAGGEEARGKGAADMGDSVLDDMLLWPKLGVGESWADASEEHGPSSEAQPTKTAEKAGRSRWGKGQRGERIGKREKTEE